MTRIKEYIDICRMAWRARTARLRRATTVQGPAARPGRAPGLGKPLKLINHPVRADIPIWWASLMGKSVEATAEHGRRLAADHVHPGAAPIRSGATSSSAGLAKRSPDLGRLEISAPAASSPSVRSSSVTTPTRILDTARPMVALYVGGMGARGKNFYNTSPSATATRRRPWRSRTSTSTASGTRRRPRCRRSGSRSPTWSGRGATSRSGSRAYKEAGVTVLSVNPVGPDAVKTIEQLRELVADA